MTKGKFTDLRHPGQVRSSNRTRALAPTKTSPRATATRNAGCAHCQTGSPLKAGNSRAFTPASTRLEGPLVSPDREVSQDPKPK